jgi:hypothetical protein
LNTFGAGLGWSPKEILREMEEMKGCGIDEGNGARLLLLERVDVFIQEHTLFYVQYNAEGLCFLEPARGSMQA